MITWGLAWFQNQRETYVSEDVTIVHRTGTKPVAASVIEPGTEISANGIKVKSDKTLFIVKTTLLDGIHLQRGMKFVRSNGDTYELITEKGTPVYMNDPNRLDTVFPTKLLCS